MKQLFALLALSCAAASAGTLFMGAYPNVLLVVDEAQGKVTDQITLETGLPTSLRLSNDKKLLYIFTNDRSGFEVMDVATHKVLNHFVLNDATSRYRMQGATPDPEGKLMYSTTMKFTKLVDRYEMGKPQYSIIDIAQQKITKSVEQPPEEPAAPGAGGGGGGGGGGFRGSGFEVSPDGKYLYQFGSSVTVLKAEDFSEVEKIALERPEDPSMQDLGLSIPQESLSDPNQRVSIFNYSDPIVHNRVFGLATFDLNKRKFDFKPIGPAPQSMAGMRISPDKKEAFTVIANGTGGNKRCEFWALDVASSKITRTAEVPCRSRFTLGMSTDGTKLFLYGASFDIEVYDAKTLKLEATWDLGHDATMAGMIALP
jgi:DNA-binding beta-propeller fold protein YncE